jgi:hypothetical protein
MGIRLDDASDGYPSSDSSLKSVVYTDMIGGALMFGVRLHAVSPSGGINAAIGPGT